MYEIPPNVKTSPKNQWVWELKERMEEAHEKVRQNTRTAMLRQKRYHDLKLSWQKFENGDEAYVYFPVRKTGHSSKSTESDGCSVSPPNICGFLFRMRST
jgi:hypothetical protein